MVNLLKIAEAACRGSQIIEWNRIDVRLQRLLGLWKRNDIGFTAFRIPLQVAAQTVTDDRNDKGNWTGGRVGVGQLKGTKYGISAAAYLHLGIKSLTLE